MVSLRGDTTVNVNLRVMSSAFYPGSASIRIYPNPVVSRLYVESDRPLLRAELSSIQGMLVKRYTGKELKESMDLSHISPGVYVLRIYPEKGAPLVTPVILSK